MRVMGYALAASVAACGFEGSAGTVGGPGADAANEEADAAPGADAAADAALELCTEAPEGIVAWWDGEELGVDIAGDFTMGENDFRGAPTVTAGMVGGALTIDLEMNGDSQERVTINNAPQLTTFTIEGWIFRTDDGNDYQSVYGLECEIGLYLLDDRLNFYRREGQCGFGNDDVLVGDTAIGIDDWHHVAATYDGTEVRLYLDGVLDGTAETDLDLQLTSTARIGGVDVQDGQHLFGQIDELTVYDRALAEPEIAAIAAAAAGKCKP